MADILEGTPEKACCRLLHFACQEAFISTPPVEPAADGSIPEAPLEPGMLANIRFARAGKTAEATELTVLEAAEACGVTIPY